MHCRQHSLERTQTTIRISSASIRTGSPRIRRRLPPHRCEAAGGGKRGEELFVLELFLRYLLLGIAAFLGGARGADVVGQRASLRAGEVVSLGDGEPRHGKTCVALGLRVFDHVGYWRTQGNFGHWGCLTGSRGLHTPSRRK